MKIKRLTALLLSLVIVLAIAFTACNDDTPIDPQASAQSDEAVDESGSGTEANDNVAENQMFTERDSRTEYDKSSCVLINLKDNAIEASSKSVVIDGTTATITDEGTYVVSGTLTNGMLAVRAEKTDKLQIVLNNASINSSSNAPIYIASAKKVFVTLADGTNNTISNSGTFTPLDTNNIDATLFSTEDLTLNGHGKLTVKSPAGHGIVSKDDLVITSGTYDITAANRGLDANDSVRIKDASIKLNTGKDGVRAANSTDTSKGFVYMQSGSLGITAKGDGISSSAYTQILGGDVKITTSSTDGLVSFKGIKAATTLTVGGGNLELDTGDHALKADKAVYIKNGEVKIKTAADAINAEGFLNITGGVVNAECREGLDCPEVEISGGTVNIKAEDDAIGVAVKDINAENQTGELLISGGEIKLSTQLGDCIDVKGTFNLRGGKITAYGGQTDKSDIIACTEKVTVVNGTLLGFGWTVTEDIFSQNGRPTISQTITEAAAGTKVRLINTNQKDMVSLTLEAPCDNVLVIMPGIVKGTNYTLEIGGKDCYQVQGK